MIHLHAFIEAMHLSPEDSNRAWIDAGCCDCLRLAFEGDLRAYFLAGVLTVQWLNPVAKMDVDELQIIIKSLRMANAAMQDVWETDEQRILMDGIIARVQIAIQRAEGIHNVD